MVMPRFAFLFQVIGGGRALAVLRIVDVDDLVLLTGVVQHALGRGGLPASMCAMMPMLR